MTRFPGLSAGAFTAGDFKSGRRSLLRINQDPVVDENDQVILAIARHIRHRAFTGLRQGIVSTAEGMLFKHLPSVTWHQLALFAEEDQVQIVSRRFHEHELFATTAS